MTKDITKDALRKYKSYFKDKGLIPNEPQLLAMDLLADIHTKLILGSGGQAKGGVELDQSGQFAGRFEVRQTRRGARQSRAK